MTEAHRWCQPGDRQEHRIFIVRFEDADRGDAVFDGPDSEAEARAYYDIVCPTYNVFLFAAEPRCKDRLIASAPALVEALEAIVKAAEDGDEQTAIALAHAALAKARGED